MIKRIIFDIDNTLIDFPKNYEIYFNQVLNKHNVGISAKTLYEVIGRYDTIGKYDFHDKRLLLEFINNELNLNLDKSFLDDFFLMYNKLITPVSNETIDVLNYLYNKYELVALTNWFTESQKERLNEAGIINYFDNVFGTDLVPMKPNYESFKAAMENRKICECIMIGDNLNIDIKTPSTMGMKVYHLSKNKTSYPTIDKLERLKEML